MEKIFLKALAVACLACAASTTAGAQSAQNLGLTRVSSDEVARVHGLTADYVRTPNGYFHASCVQHIDQSEQLQADGSIRRADGNIRKVAACAYPHFLKSGVRVEATEGASHLPVVYNGYLQLVSAVLPSGSHKLTAYMTVPADPRAKGFQTIYFFPGLEDIENVVTILQPVLGWNGYGDQAWTIASWNCCKDGTTFVGNHVTVQPGDLIYGAMTNPSGKDWNITATDQSQPDLPSAVLATTNYGQVFDWIFAGALETYGVNFCTQFPARGPIAFTNIKVYLNNKVVASPPWQIWTGTDRMTSCTGSTIVDSRDVNISY